MGTAELCHFPWLAYSTMKTASLVQREHRTQGRLLSETSRGLWGGSSVSGACSENSGIQSLQILSVFPAGGPGTQEYRLWDKTRGHHYHFVNLGKPLQLSEPQFPCFSDRDHCIKWDDGWAKDVCLYHCAWCLVHSSCSRNVSSPFPLWDPHICCPSRKCVEVMERVFHILSVIHHLLSLF